MQTFSKQEVAEMGLPPLYEDAVIEKVVAPFGDKMEALKKILPDYRTVILTGNDSPAKDAFAAVLLLHIRRTMQKHTAYIGSYRAVTNEDMVRNTAFAFMSADKYNGNQMFTFNQTVRELYTRGKTIVIGAESVETLDARYGQGLMDFLSHSATIVNLPVEREIIKTL